MGNRQQGDRRRQRERLGPRRSRQHVLETRRQDRRTARRQGIGKAAGRGALARRKEGGRDSQAKRSQKLGSAQDRAEEVAVRPSLRANGSRECAPDERLREAIHVAAKLKSGLLRRFAPRNDVEYDSAISRRDSPE